MTEGRAGVVGVVDEVAGQGAGDSAGESAIRVVTLSNPSKRNALTRAMLRELAESVSWPASVSSARMPSSAAAVGPERAPPLQPSDTLLPGKPLRAVVLRGDEAGGAFSAGFDITSIDDDERDRGLDPIEEPASAIEQCPVPVIAAVDGACMGGALELAMACTMRIASKSAKLAMPPAKLGLVYSARGLQRFLRAVGPSRAQRMFLTGERVDVNDALAWGLIDAVVDDAAAEAVRIARVIAANAPLAVSGMLEAIRRLSKPGGPAADDIDFIAKSREYTLSSEDLQEGVRAFAEKRAPIFRGK